MAMSVTYTNFAGELVHEARGAVQRFYAPDTLGSTAALLDSTGVTDTYEYWPNGEERLHAGSGVTPFTFVGTLGYYRDSLQRFYVRARNLRADLVRWMTVDPLWPNEPAYEYARNAPQLHVDPSGLWVHLACIGACVLAGGCLAGVWIACSALWGEPEFWPCISDFLSTLPLHSQAGCVLGILGCLTCVVRYLTKGGKKSCCPPPVKKALQGAKDLACNAPRTCKAQRITCPDIKKRTAQGIACIVARLAVMFVCFGGGDSIHWGEVKKAGEVLALCITKWKAGNC